VDFENSQGCLIGQENAHMSILLVCKYLIFMKSLISKKKSLGTLLTLLINNSTISLNFRESKTIILFFLLLYWSSLMWAYWLPG